MDVRTVVSVFVGGVLVVAALIVAYLVAEATDGVSDPVVYLLVLLVLAGLALLVARRRPRT